MPPKITRSAACGTSTDAQRVEDLALALMGVVPLPPETLAVDAAWERTGAPATVGRAAITNALGLRTAPARIAITEVTAKGRAGTVSGRFEQPDQGSFIFCHVLRFTATAPRQLAQIVTIERQEFGRK